MAALSEERCLVCGSALTGAEVLQTPDRKGLAEGSFRVAICPGCGGGNTAPIVAPAELGAFYGGEEYVPHASGGMMGPLFRVAMGTRLRASRLFRPLRRVAPGRLLEVGPGRGDLLAALKQRGWRAEGLDPSPLACEATRRRGVEARLGTIEEVELDEAAYDAIVFHHSLEHVTDPVSVLARSLRALRPGGLVLIGVPNFASGRARSRGEDWWLLELPRHRFHFTPEALERALSEAGFETAELGPKAALIGPAASLQQRTVGHFLESGPAFLAGYAFNLAVFPIAWGSNRLRGGGELLNAVAARPSTDAGPA